MGQFLNGVDSGLVGTFQALAPWKAALGHPSHSAIGLLNASMYIAGLITAPIAGYVADRWGRTWCVRYSACTMLVGGVVGTLPGISGANGYNLFLASRIIIGSGLAFCLMISPILLQEMPHPNQRVTMAALFNQNYALGGFLIAWILFGCSYLTNNWSWRIPYIIHFIPAVYLVIAM